MVLPMIPLHDRFGYINNPSFCMINISQTKITLNAFIQVFNRYIMVSKVLVHYDPEVADGKKIVKVSVNRGTGRPYYWEEKGMQPAGVYVRQGTSAAPSTEVAIRQMIKETDGDSYEEMRSLDQGLSFTYASAAFQRNGLEFGEPQMKTLGVLSSEGIYTNLGLLLSDQCPHIIKAAVFSGIDQDVFQDRKEFTGSLLKQVDDAYAFLEMRNEKTATFDGIHRIDHLAYPEAALREALLNAVIHRDYSFYASTLIQMDLLSRRVIY